MSRTRRRRDVNALPDEGTITVESATEEEQETSEERSERKNTERILALARKRFRTVQSAHAHFRKEALDDTKFRVGTWGGKSFQWDRSVEEARKLDDQPCLTINRIPGFIRQVTNAARMARLRILISPVDDFGDPDTAEAIQGIIRNIENQSFADRAYAMGSEKQAEIGLGIIKLATEYAEPDNPKSFRVKIRIKRVKNPLRVYVDPTAEEADWSDARYAFEVSDVDQGTYKDLSGGKKAPEPASFDGFDDQDTLTGDWFPNGKIRVATYYSREPKGPKKHMAQLSDGAVIKYPNPEQMQRLLAMGVHVEKDRWVQKTVMVVRKITGLTIDETTEWPAKSQPYIPVLGDELEVDGELDFRGVTRDSKDGARLYNAEVSGLIGAVAQSLKAPVIGWRGQFGAEGTKQREAWLTAHKRPHAFLEVDPMDIDGKPAGFPQRNALTMDISGIVEAIHQTDEDLKTTGGFRDASLGERGPQESGRAIKLRQDQDQLGSSHYLDNLRFALCAVGRQLIDLIRACYDVAQVVRIVGSDERAKKVLVFVGKDNDPRRDPNFQLPKGVTGVFDLGVGEFDVEVSAGHSNTRRQEAADAMGNLLPSLPPEIAVNFLDLYFLLLDLPMAKQMADRAKKMLPKELQDPEDGTQPVPPEAQQQIAELTEQLQMAMAAAKQMQQQIATDEVKMRGALMTKQQEIASRERIENAKAKLALIQSQVDLKGEQALTLLAGHLDAQSDAREAAFTRQLEAMKHQNALELEDEKHKNKQGEMVLQDRLTPDPPPAAPAKKKKAA